MKIKLKNKIFIVGLATFALIVIFGPLARLSAQGYQLLQPLPGITSVTPGGDNALGTYLNAMIQIFIGVCAVLAVVMIVLGGLEYMTSELPGNKEHGKERITNAVFGLVLALGAYALLFTINPDLLKTDFVIPDATVTVDLGGESSTPFAPISKPTLQALGITCNGSGGSSALPAIGQSFVGHATYSQTNRNTSNSTTAFVDCSSYVSQVYNCAGLGNPGGTTTGIFASSNTVSNVSTDGTTVNGTALKVGDLLGWKKGENKEANGHVVMYIGNGQVIDAQGSGVAVRSLNSAQFQGRIKYIKKL